MRELHPVALGTDPGEFYEHVWELARAERREPAFGVGLTFEELEEAFARCDDPSPLRAIINEGEKMSAVAYSSFDALGFVTVFLEPGDVLVLDKRRHVHLDLDMLGVRYARF